MGSPASSSDSSRGSHQRPIIQELNQSSAGQSTSGWDDGLQALATAMNGDGIVASDSHGSVADEYRASLGCDQL